MLLSNKAHHVIHFFDLRFKVKNNSFVIPCNNRLEKILKFGDWVRTTIFFFFFFGGGG